MVHEYASLQRPHSPDSHPLDDLSIGTPILVKLDTLEPSGYIPVAFLADIPPIEVILGQDRASDRLWQRQNPARHGQKAIEAGS